MLVILGLILLGVLIGAVLVGVSLWWAVAAERSRSALPSQLDQSDFWSGTGYTSGDGGCSGHGAGDCGHGH